MLVLLSWILVLISDIEAIVIAKDNSDKDGATALLYLMKYGYLEPRQQGSSALLTQKGLNDYITGAVRDFQTFAGIESTGVLDPVTVELMGTPRCGVRDIIGPGATAKRRRKKRFLDQNISLLWYDKKLLQICVTRQQMEAKNTDLQNHQVPRDRGHRC